MKEKEKNKGSKDKTIAKETPILAAKVGRLLTMTYLINTDVEEIEQKLLIGGREPNRTMKNVQVDSKMSERNVESCIDDALTLCQNAYQTLEHIMVELGLIPIPIPVTED